MPIDRSELSSVSDLLEQLRSRVEEMADGALAERDEHAANELYGIERELSNAARRLGRFLRR